MLLISELKNKTETIKKGLAKKNFKELHLIDEAIALDDKRKNFQTKKDVLLAKRNSISKEIGFLFKSGNVEEGNQKKLEVSLLKDEIEELEESFGEIDGNLRDVLVQIPNMPNESVPEGNADTDNEVIFSVDDLPKLPEGAKPHWELASLYDIIDFETPAKITGAGFVMFKGKGAVLQRALINFFLDEAIAAGYEEVVPPLLVNEASAFATGSLPDKEGQMYYINADDLYLIPTAEIPITNIYRDKIVSENEFPIKMVGYTPCFRREAGSHGKHVRGLNRVHQFDKVEIVQIAKAENSYNVLDEMVKHVESLLIKLELPYRILRLCGGDLSFASALTYDFEVWSAAQERWLEVSSVSNFESFQANRLKLRRKDDQNKKHLCHTLNGSALALARIIACLLENNQTSTGILIPKILQPYTRYTSI